MNIKNTITITEARKEIFNIVEKVQKLNNYFTFSVKNIPKAVLMSFEEFNSIMETMEILSDPKIMAKIEKAEEEYENGDYISWEQMKNEMRMARTGDFIIADKGRKKYNTKKVKK